MFNMGGKDKKSAGRCGACTAMGCIPIPFEINDEIIKFQKFQLAHTDKNFFAVIARKICIFFNRLLYTWRLHFFLYIYICINLKLFWLFCLKIGKFLSLNISGNTFYNQIDASNLGYSSSKSNVVWSAKVNTNFTIKYYMFTAL